VTAEDPPADPATTWARPSAPQTRPSAPQTQLSAPQARPSAPQTQLSAPRSQPSAPQSRPSAPEASTDGGSPGPTVDATGLRCPLPIIRLAAAARDAPAGAVITLLSTDPAAEPDVAAWCRMRGQELLDQAWSETPVPTLTSRIRLAP
jgi:tRNA 2-thiouridine synthesizing protein A